MRRRDEVGEKKEGREEVHTHASQTNSVGTIEDGGRGLGALRSEAGLTSTRPKADSGIRTNRVRSARKIAIAGI
jgi:hypothetical protein